MGTHSVEGVFVDNEFQMDVVQRLAKIEAKLSNGIIGEIQELKTWTKEWMEGHPSKCPLVERKAAFINPILVGVITGAIVLMVDLIVKAVLH